jgi:hypothetical protein
MLNKLEKKKTLISDFTAHFSRHNQALENVFQHILHDTFQTLKNNTLSRNLFSMETISKKKLLCDKQTRP